MEILVQMIFLALSFVMLVKGADWFVDGAAGIAAKSGIPQLIIGLTIVAMGTSAPETAVSVTAALKGNADITIGNVVGSNILNILVILGIAASIVAIRVAASTIRYEIPYMIFITLALLAMGYTGNAISRVEGIILWLLFIVYLSYLFFMAKKMHTDNTENEMASRKMWQLIALMVIGLVLIVWGSNIAVDSATKIAQCFGISERFIGLTIVALGTSLPELVTSVSAARKGKADIAIGNIVGSNIYNILFVVGTSALIIPVPFAPNFVIDSLVAAGCGLLLLLGVIKTGSLKRPTGILMLLAYTAYFLYLL